MKHKLLMVAATLACVVGISATPVYADGLKCGILSQSICDSAQDGNVQTSGVFSILRFAITILTAGVGIAAVGVFVYAGILYSSAGGNADRVKQSKKLITDAVIGLVLYMGVFFVLNWLIPGGVIGK